MKNIEVKVLNESLVTPGHMMGFLGKLTQRGHRIKSMDDLTSLFNQKVSESVKYKMSELPHGTIKRFTPITVAIVGASRRFLAQARTHQVGMNYVSASLQYSDYTGAADFVVPYNILKRGEYYVNLYLDSCAEAMMTYRELANDIDNDTAGYAAPQGLRNILIMQGNHQAWDYFIRLRSCNRNTVETQYVTMRIWEELQTATADGEIMFGLSGPPCLHGVCPEGTFCCGEHIIDAIGNDPIEGTIVHTLIKHKWPLLFKEV